MWQSLTTAIIQGGPAIVALLLLLIIAQAKPKPWIVWGWQHRERVDELTRALALKDATVQELERQRNTLLLGGVREPVQ